MEDFLYAYNQPKKFAKYDLILDGKIIADEVVTKSGSIGGGEDTSNCVKINDPITITEGDNTTSITSDTISTTTLSGTLDAESMKNSLTAEAIQAVMPIAWSDNSNLPKLTSNLNLAIGENTEAHLGANAIGTYAIALDCANAIGHMAWAGENSVALGHYSRSQSKNCIAVGYRANTNKDDKPTTITIGSQFTETTDSGKIEHYCTTEGTGSITIGAGANTLNTTKTVDGVETTVESSNAITIGCKAENKGADSVVIGAQASAKGKGKIVIGAAAGSSFSDKSITIGNNAQNNYGNICIGADASGGGAVTLGHNCSSVADGVSIGRMTHAEPNSVSIGVEAKANAGRSVAIGKAAQASDYGVVVFRSTSEDSTKTQLYFSGANTPLALKYYPTEWEKKQDVDEQGNPKVDDEGNPIMIDDKDKPTKGQAMMGYVVSKVITNDEGKQETKVVECGTNLLAALFPNHGLGDNPFQPTTTAIDGEIISFHPSDLDMPIEETPIEEEYKPLPIYPIVEPTIDEISE